MKGNGKTQIARRAYSVEEIAAAGGMSIGFVRLELKRPGSGLKGVKRGRRVLIPAHIADAYLGAGLKA